MIGICFKKTPALFGYFHISALIICVLCNYLSYRYYRNKDESSLLKVIHHTGIFMLVMELFKQLFCYFYVYDKQINMWFFPWQLCSMSMYCAAFIYQKRRIQNALLVFLQSFGLFAAIIALAFPEDMLRPQIFLTCYSFLYHFLMIFLAILSALITKKRNDLNFRDSIILFIIMAIIAEIINILSHQIFHDIHKEPDMFYITPYYPTTQLFFSDIAKRFGILTEIIIYLSSIILASFFIYRIINKKAIIKVGDLNNGNNQ